MKVKTHCFPFLFHFDKGSLFFFRSLGNSGLYRGCNFTFGGSFRHSWLWSIRNTGDNWHSYRPNVGNDSKWCFRFDLRSIRRSFYCLIDRLIGCHRCRFTHFLIGPKNQPMESVQHHCPFYYAKKLGRIHVHILCR